MSPSALEALWISESEVVSMMDIGGAIEALEAGLLAEASGKAQNMEKTYLAWPGGSLHALGAGFPKQGFSGTKTWTHTEGGATPLLILFDSGTGSLKAVIEAFALGQMRTAAASGVATKWLAAQGAEELAVIGTGKQALAQVAAVAAVRPLTRVRVYGRNEERRRQFAERIQRELDLEAVEMPSVAEAVRGAPIVTTVTRATEPFVNAAMLSKGAHVNAVGAIAPTGAEVGADVLSRCSRIVVDSLPQAQRFSRELADCFGPEGSPDRVRSLASLVASARPRAEAEDLTLFKSLGMGISDLSLGIELYRKAVAGGLGRKLPHPLKVAPRLKVSPPIVRNLSEDSDVGEGLAPSRGRPQGPPLRGQERKTASRQEVESGKSRV